MRSWLLAALGLLTATGHPAPAPGATPVTPVALHAPQAATGRIAGADSILALRLVLARHDFATLHDLFAAAEARALHDPASEADFVHLLDVFATGDTVLQPHLMAWVKARPRDAVARSARARYYARQTQRYWVGKGEGGPTRENRLAWRRSATFAEADLRAARRLDSSSVMPDAVQLELTMADGGTDEGERAMSHALAHLPYSASLRYAYLEVLSPRGYGSLPAESAFVARAQGDVFRNPALQGIGGMMSFERATELQQKGDFAGAVSALTQALAYGEHWRYLEDRGAARLRMGQPREAVDDLTRSIALRPGNASSYSLRAMAWHYLAEGAPLASRWRLHRRTVDDLRTAARLDPTEPQLLSITRGDVASVFSVWKTIWP